jgi:hypothetical protein
VCLCSLTASLSPFPHPSLIPVSLSFSADEHSPVRTLMCPLSAPSLHSDQQCSMATPCPAAIQAPSASLHLPGLVLTGELLTLSSTL